MDSSKRDPITIRRLWILLALMVCIVVVVDVVALPIASLVIYVSLLVVDTSQPTIMVLMRRFALQHRTLSMNIFLDSIRNKIHMNISTYQRNAFQMHSYRHIRRRDLANIDSYCKHSFRSRICICLYLVDQVSNSKSGDMCDYNKKYK